MTAPQMYEPNTSRAIVAHLAAQQFGQIRNGESSTTNAGNLPHFNEMEKERPETGMRLYAESAWRRVSNGLHQNNRWSRDPVQEGQVVGSGFPLIGDRPYEAPIIHHPSGKRARIAPHGLN